MNKNILIVLGGGFLIAILVALLVQVSLSGGKKKQPTVAAAPMTMIVVAAKPLNSGAKVNNTSVRWQEWPEDAPFPGAITRPANKADMEAHIAAEGRLLRDFAEGEPIPKSALVDGDGNFMAASLREGMRAVSLEVRPAAIVSGFVSPGDYVDIILTYRARVRYSGDNVDVENMVVANLDKLATETIMENVRVLAVDQRMSNNTGDGKSKSNAKVAKLVTVEVTPEGAEVIGLARKMGDLSLALRRLGDDSVSSSYSPATTDARVTHIWDEIYATMETMTAPSAYGGNNTGQMGNSVRIYSGAVVQEIPYGQ